MGHGSRGSWVSSLMGQMGHGSQNVTNCLLWLAQWSTKLDLRITAAICRETRDLSDVKISTFMILHSEP